MQFDDVLAEIFKTFPNGLTPDPKSIQKVLEKYAHMSSGRWKITEGAKQVSTAHTEAIRQILALGKSAGYKVFAGKREQPELCKDGSILRSQADYANLSALSSTYTVESLARLEMIDAIWLDGAAIVCVFEVEHSTDFMSAIQRGSNLDSTIPKYMIIPSKREAELLSKSDPLFKQSFKQNNWRYAQLPDLARLCSFSQPSVAELNRITKELSK